MDELEGAEQLGRDGDLAPVLGAALQGPDPDRGGLDVDVHGPDGQGLGDPGGGVCEREGEGLVGRPRRQARGFEEALALIGGQVLPAAGVLKRITLEIERLVVRGAMSGKGWKTASTRP